MKKEVTLRDFLTKQKVNDEELYRLIGYMNISWVPLVRIEKICGLIGLDLSIEQKVQAIVSAIKSCNLDNPNCNHDLYIELSREGYQTFRFNGGHNHNPYNTGVFEDFGFGNTNTDYYDDYIDSVNDDDFKPHM